MGPLLSRPPGKRSRPGAAALALALALVATAVAPAHTEELPPPPDGWEPLLFRSVEKPTLYEAPPTADAGLRAESRCGASALIHALPSGVLARAPRLSWRWRVERPLPPRDERTRQGDDFAARVYVLFRFDPEQASFWERTRHRLGRRLLGTEPPGRAINYVWSSNEPAGASWPSPYMESSRMISMGRGPTKTWRREEVDPGADYRRLFGAEPPEALAVALMTDSDNSCLHATAWYADFSFLPEGSD